MLLQKTFPNGVVPGNPTAPVGVATAGGPLPRPENTPLEIPWLLSYAGYLLLIAAFAAELFLPLLIWKTPVPGAARWLADGLVLIIAGLACTRMLLLDRIPKAFLVVIGAAFIGITVAAFEGQPILASLWGIWRMFMYPMVGFFAYLQSAWPQRVAARVFLVLVALLGLEVVVQLGQYAAGQTPGDNLAGTFGWKGVGSLVMFVLLVLCLAFGKWLTDGSWRALVFAIVMGLLASVFGEMKVYPVALLLIAATASGLYLWRGGQFYKILNYGVVLIIATAAFLFLYNIVISEGRGVRRLEAYTDLSQVTKYLNNVNYNSETGRYNLGRGFALTYGWEIIQRDTTTFLFGMGIGTRNESSSLGVVGRALEDSDYGVTSGTSLLVLMQETGLVGLGMLGLFFGWLILALLRDIRLDPDSDVTVLRYGIVLFSLFWPLWLWYHRAWNFGPSMILYWALVGYLLRQRPPHEPAGWQSQPVAADAADQHEERWEEQVAIS